MDITGQKFGRLTAIKIVDKGKHEKWLFKCDCGKQHIAQTSNIMNGHTKSCGCLQREIAIKTNTTHGMHGTRIYAIYSGIKSRCLNKNNHAYDRYGGRGLTVCEEWMDNPQAFIDWAINNGYSDDLSIERKNNNKGYSPDNCMWATATEQSRNRKSNILITIKGITKLAVEWANDFNVNPSVITKRIKRGWNAVDAVIMPLGKGGKRTQDDFNRAKLSL